LIGAIPIEGQLDTRILTFFNRILLQPQSLEYDLVRRQLAIKDLQSHSWVTTVRIILAKYNLPSAYTLLQQNRRKTQWKRQVKAAVVYYWNSKLKEAAQSKKTMKYINLPACSVEYPHFIYTGIPTDPLKVMMTAVKVKLLTQRYPLTSTHCAGKQRRSICPLCDRVPETLQHFLLECEATGNNRERHLTKIHQILAERSYPKLAPNSMDWYTQLLLDPSAITRNESVQKAINMVSLQLIFNLHHNRAVLLGGGSRYTWARLKGNVNYNSC
jgi:hypothetical protein